jgi:hypothetical protein
MNSLKNLNILLKQIKTISKDIMRASLELMNDLKSEDCEIVELILERRHDLSPDKALELAQEESLGLVKDAEQILKELPLFVVSDSNGFHFNENMEECPFLIQVWRGDTYDQDDIGGLKLLKDDLQSQLADISIEKFAERCINVAT